MSAPVTSGSRLPRAALAVPAVAVLLGSGFAAGLALSPGSDQGAPPHARPVAAAAPASPAPAAAPQTFVDAEAATLPVSTADAARYTPLYRQAARRFGVNWLLIASIHRQETAFSTAPGTYRGLNFARCCAGPMQFNVRNGNRRTGSRSTWARFRDGYTAGTRPASYPHATATHPSVYDDFDAVMAAAKLLRANGASDVLDGRAWSAAYQYYGPGDVAAVDYANAVMARATAWSQGGFDPQAVDDQQLISNFESLYGGYTRAQIEAAAKAAAKDERGHRRHRRRGHSKPHQRAAKDHKRHPRHTAPARPSPRRHDPRPARPDRHPAPRDPQSTQPAATPEPEAHTSTVPSTPSQQPSAPPPAP